MLIGKLGGGGGDGKAGGCAGGIGKTVGGGGGRIGGVVCVEPSLPAGLVVGVAGDGGVIVGRVGGREGGFVAAVVTGASASAWSALCPSKSRNAGVVTTRSQYIGAKPASSCGTAIVKSTAALSLPLSLKATIATLAGVRANDRGNRFTTTVMNPESKVVRAAEPASKPAVDML